MSSAPAAKKPLPCTDPEAGLILVAASLLIPLFRTGPVDVPLAQEMAICAIKAYCPESSADYVNIARTIAFSMASLALLGNAGSPDTSFPEKMRAFGRANVLSRSADQSERTMMQRRRYQRANPLGEPEDCGPPAPRTEQDTAAKQAEIAAAVQEYVTARGPAAAAPIPQPAPASSAQPASKPPASPPPPSVSPILRPIATPTTAIHHAVPQTGTGHPGATSFKASLRQQTSLQSALKPDAVPHRR